MPPNGGTAAADILLPPYTEKPLGDLDRLELALDRLERRILDLNVQLATDETIANAIAGEDKGIRSAQWALRDQFERTKKVLAYSRNALADGRTLVRTIKGAGRDIRDRAGIIAGTVNTQVQGKQHDLAKAADLLKDAHDITSSILNIGGTTAADQTEVTSSDPPISMAYPPQGRMIQVARLMSAPDLQNVQMGSTLLAAAPAGTPAPSSPSAAASASSQASVPPKKKPKATTAASKNEPPTSAELQAIRDKLDIAIKGIAEREAEAQKKAEAEAHEKELAARDKTIRELTARLNAKELSCGRASAAGCATALAEETERLYAARRPVLQELLNFRRKARAVAATPECAELAVLRVTPNEVVRAKPGDTVSYIVSQRAAGSPLAVLQGPTDAETGAKFDFSPMQGTTLFVAKIQIGPKMPDQVIRLVVADSKGVVSQTIPIVAGGSTPKAPDPPASAPKPAASSASTARSASAAARFYQPLSSLHRAVLVASHSLG